MSNNTLITGIYISANNKLEELSNTLYHLSLNHNENITHRVICLLDQAALEICQYLDTHGIDSIQLSTEQSGHVFYFNQLLSQKANYYLYIDCGVLLAEQCLIELLNAMAQHRQAGIVAPTINNGWSRQSLYQDIEPANVNIHHRAVTLRADNCCQDLTGEIAESCILVDQAMVETIGFADESFLDGYCWEVDYQHRAKYAGFDCLWVKQAYAHKVCALTNTSRESSLLRNIRKVGQNEKRYQQLNHLYIPLEQNSVRAMPLISCIMPTAKRAEFVAQTLQYFCRQSYNNKELVVVYDSLDDLPSNISSFDHVYLVRAPENTSIGGKRNLALEHASGDIIFHWDDDDWRADNLLEQLVAPILTGEADITALHNTPFFYLCDLSVKQADKKLYEDMFVAGVHGGTLMYKKDSLAECRYPDISLREDACLLEALLAKKAKLTKVDGKEIYCYLRHGRNAWSFEHEPRFQLGWQTKSIPRLMVKDLDFYQQFQSMDQTEHTRMGQVSNGSSQPKVSCIMPTKNRAEFVTSAIAHFLKQSYANKELVIVDDGDEAVEHLIPNNVDNIQYYKLRTAQTIGQKRNIANQLANGEIIVHWDDDDWMAKHWLELQVNSLIATNADVTGITKSYFYAPQSDSAWLYSYPQQQRPWVLGGSLCYWKSVWQTNPFDAIDVGEDNQFLWGNKSLNIAPHTGFSGYIAMIHDSNTSHKDTSGAYWQAVSADEVKSLLNGEID